MIKLTGKLTNGRRVYALICHETDEPLEAAIFGWEPKLARLALGWKMSNWLPLDSTKWTDEQIDEASAMIEAIRDPAIDAWGYQLVDAHRCVVSEAAWTLRLDDLTRYYEGGSRDEYEIREWCARFICDLRVKHALLDMLVEFDRNLTPEVVAQIHAQLDEEG
jgi:hypothetical protein